MNTPDPHSTDRTFYDDTDYADVDLEPAKDVTVEARPAPRSTFAIRMEGRTIRDLRELAEQRGTRPTQLAREWIEERLEQERKQARSTEDDARLPGALLPSLDAIIALLVAILQKLDTAVVAPAGPTTSPMSKSIARALARVPDLELQAAFARTLVERLQNRASISVPPDVGIDFLVRSGDRCWAIEFKGADVDLTPSVEHLADAARHFDATAVLISPGSPDEKTSSMAEASGVVVRRPDELEDLLAEMSTERAG